MDTLSKRLKSVLYKLDLNQTEAAKISGISQQSINYIIRNNRKESRLSSKIADGLKINSEWLIYGRGEMVSLRIYKIPIIDDYLILQRYLNERELDRNIQNLLTNRLICAKPFSVKIDSNNICICKSNNKEQDDRFIEEYLYFTEVEKRIIKSHTVSKE